jgi:hypothetical protein
VDKGFHVAWSADGSSTLTLNMTGRAEVFDFMDNPIQALHGAGALRLTLSGNPVLISGPVESVAEARPDELLADSAHDFARREDGDRHGWSYGYTVERPVTAVSSTQPASLAASALNPTALLQDDWDVYWGAERYPYLKIGREVMQPAVDGQSQVWAIRRWTASSAGPIKLNLVLRKQEVGGDGVDALVRRDGITVWSQQLTTTETLEQTLPLAVEAGSNIDLVLRPGPNLDGAFDGVEAVMRITRAATH